jgi:hypothetical protein
MNNNEFQLKLTSLYDEHLLPTKRKQRTFNELCYALRMDASVTDYNISTVENGIWSCIPSVKETFIPVKCLSKRVVKVQMDEDDYGFDGICLTVYLED